MQVKKRSGEIVEYNVEKIQNAVMKCFQGADNPNNKILPFEERDEREKQRMHVFAQRVAEDVTWQLENCEVYAGEDVVSVERIQDLVEIELAKVDVTAAIAYAKYRIRRANIRQSENTLMKQIGEIVGTPAVESDMKRSNANIDGDTSMGAMLQFGTTAAKAYNAANLLTPQHASAHRNGDIHIHDFDFYALTTTCTQIDLLKLFHGGFNTGHGYLREPQSIGSYAALAAIAIQSNQNDQHGGQSIPAFDFAMAEGVRKSFTKSLKRRIAEAIEEKTIWGDENIDWEALSEDDRFKTSQTKAAEVIQNARQLEGIAVHGIELREKGLKGSIPLVFSGNDFTHYSNLHAQEGEADFDLAASQLQYVSRMTGCKFQYIPLRIEKTESGAPIIICSRSFAMELQQERFFFGDEPLAAEGKPVYAYVLSANPRSVRVECMGVETSIPRAYLSARTIVMNAAEFVGAKPGMALEVAISRLKVDKENRIVDLRLSGVLREIQLGLAHSVKDIDPTARPRFHGTVYAISRDYYIIRLEENGIFALVPRKDGVINAESLQYNDLVSVEVTGKDEETNRVIGRCVLRARA